MKLKQDPMMSVFTAVFFFVAIWTMAHTVRAASEAEKADFPERAASKAGKADLPVRAASKAGKADLPERAASKAGKADPPVRAVSKAEKADPPVRAVSKAEKADPPVRAVSKAEKADLPERAASKAEKADLPQEHEIKQGETLGQIAQSYGISLNDLMTANGLDNPNKIFFGQKLRLPGNPKDGILTKQGVQLRVPKGFTLSRIAAAYGVSPRAIIRANQLNNPDRLREGDKLLIPGAKQVMELVPPPPCYKNPVTVYRVRTDETLELPLEFCNGKPNMNGLKQISDLARSIARPTDVNLHPRVLTLLQQIADHYPGKRIEIISGQRAKKAKGNESYHNKGRALDFRVEGISNLALSNYLRTFDKVGVGYYPNSVFIHMDTREKDAYWIDYSEPGEKAIYGRRGLTEEKLQAIRDRRKARRHIQKHGVLSADNDADSSPAASSEEEEALPLSSTPSAEESAS